MNMKMHKEERGIILLEAIIAVGVLATIFAATIGLYMSSVGGIRTSNDQLVATFLAQDAMEAVIAKRQYNYDQDKTYLDGLDGCTMADPCNTAFDDDISVAFTNCGAFCPLYLTGGEYKKAGLPAEISLFSRTIVVDEIMLNQEAVVTVNVIWKDRLRVNVLPVTYNIYAYKN
jgi:Tfp pilus assembly protein PilV